MTEPEAQPLGGELLPVYVASRASLPERGQMWRDFRALGYQITSSWIDEDGEGATRDFGELWLRIVDEIQNSAALVLYAEAADFPLKGALTEAGLALGMGKPVFVCLPDLGVLPRNYRPIGSWIAHPLVTRCDDISVAMKLAASTRADLPRATAETEDDPSIGKLLATIADGLRHAIRDHGPITKDLIGSASKRVWSRLRGTKYDPFRATPRATADALDNILIESLAEPWICVEEKPCENAVPVHWQEMISALAAMKAPRATGELSDERARALAREIIGNVNSYAEDNGELSISAFGPLAKRIAATLVSTPRATGETTVEANVWRQAIAIVAGFPTERYSGSGAHLTNALTFRDGVVKALEAAQVRAATRTEGEGEK